MFKIANTKSAINGRHLNLVRSCLAGHVVMMGYLIHQVGTHGGLADKNDDMMEKAHQPWKCKKERTWNVKNLKTRQRTQMKSMCKRNIYRTAAFIKKVTRKQRQLHKNQHMNPVTRSTISSNAPRAVKQETRQAFGMLEPTAAIEPTTG